MASIRVASDAIQITGSVDMRMHRVSDLETDLSKYPLEEHQGASKKYVDAQRDLIQQGLLTLIDNGGY